MNIMFLGQVMDKQTGLYILESLHNDGHKVTGVDIRRVINDLGTVQGQETILEEVKDLNVEPDIVMVLKGLEMTPNTLKEIKELFPKAIFVNWFFDKYLGSLPIWENKQYFDMIKMYDYYFCSLKGAADKLNELGFDNVYYLDEACYPRCNGETHLNSFQKRKYGSDISFIGSIGFMEQHANRIPILKKVINEGFNMRIWGGIICDWKVVPPEIKQCHTQEMVINEDHSKAVQASAINLGIDQDPELDMGHSARLYRVLCCGGLYLSTATKGLDEMFKVNKEGELPTGEEELVVFHNEDELISLIDFLLEHEDIRNKIGENGKKAVLEKHTFSLRLKDMLELIETNKRK